MHPEAFAWAAVQARILGPFNDVLEIGSRDVNGSVRCLFPRTNYVGLDLAAGPSVDVVADAAIYRPVDRYDACLCLEVLEHTADADAIVLTAHKILRRGGVLISTMACDPRAPHSGVDGGALRTGEYYHNVGEDELGDWLTGAGFDIKEMEIHPGRGDLYVAALKT